MRTRLARSRSVPLVLLALGLAACGRQEHARAPAAIEGLRTFEVVAGDIGAGRAWEGVVEAVGQAVLSAQTHGRVDEVRYDVDDRVSAGDVLLRLSTVEQQSGVDAARAQLRAAQAGATEAESTWRRYQALSQGQYVSRAQLEQVRAARDAAAAARDAARAQMANAAQQTVYATIRAPYAGIIGRRDVEPGESVAIGQPLMTVFAPGVLRIEVSVPQSEAEAIRAHPVAKVDLGGDRGVDAAEVTVFPAADAATHAVKVRVSLPRLDPAPQPGSTAKVAFPAVKGVAYPQIPVSALARRGEVNAVYVRADGRWSLRQLRLGARAGDAVDVIAGLRPGETVAADPVAALQALVAARRRH